MRRSSCGRPSCFNGVNTFVLLFAWVGLTACGEESIDPSGDSGGTGGSGASEQTTSSNGGTSDTGGAGTGGSDIPTNPLGDIISMQLDAFDVQPGTERQVCKIINLPAGADVDIVRMRATMQGGTSHHFNVYKQLAGDVTAPVTSGESTVHDCSPASSQLDGSAAYIFGSATPERTVDMPEGIAFHLQDGHRIILEQHVINFGQDVVQGGVDFDMIVAGEGANIQHHADIMWLANWQIFLPAAQQTAITEHCAVPYEVEVFGLMSHTHALGTHFSIEKWTPSGTEHLYDSTDWAHPLYKQFSTPFRLQTGEGFQWTCTYNNTTPNPVAAGPESTDEMCMMFAYAYPTQSLSADPFQCNRPF